ncbi:sirohydrochlorin chelatase [Mycolicibacter senuensis]|uniref:Cobalamin biosynthesis protein CbiX n=1 Tax=Mycolicibacter senuensis TaxID=386913 RepID=A0A7I9XPV6_9MYCO|nr:sirohydrochlorin chelatase [Mycolicibacter senuensis]ORW69754.1 cobalamin biosynthesis protein CbiX [Mycolicibacter senuensis]GFG71768.1 cobalamin biosynthesis protein CbiX [Mycolicibacter senuensis]
MIPILVAHGTRRPEGVLMIGELAERVGALLARPVRVAFVDVLGPTPGEILSAEAPTGRPAVVVPAFLARGYHVGVDVPTHVLASGHPDVTIAPALGPDPRVTAVVAARLTESGWRCGDAVILAAAGSSDPTARADLVHAARMLTRLLGSPVEVAFAATGAPTVTEAVAGLRRRGAARVAVASYLLADGLFQRRLHDAGADLVTQPLGTHPAIARIVADRFITARTRIPLRSGLFGDHR